MKNRILIVAIAVLPTFLWHCSKAPTSYYPLDEGKSWQYQFSTGSLAVGVGTIKILITNLPSRELNGKEVVPQKVEAGNQAHFAFLASEKDGISEIAAQSPRDAEPQINARPKYLLMFPLEVGRSWQIESQTQLLMSKSPISLEATIQSVNETVTVPAGTFEKCVLVTATGSTSKNLGMFMGSAAIEVEEHNWYAINVGLVKSIRKEKSNHMMVGSGEATLQLEKSQ